MSAFISKRQYLRQQSSPPQKLKIILLLGILFLLTSLITPAILKKAFYKLPTSLNIESQLQGSTKLMPIFGIQAASIPLNINLKLQAQKTQANVLTLEQTLHFNPDQKQPNEVIQALINRINQQFFLKTEYQQLLQYLMEENKQTSTIRVDRFSARIMEENKQTDYYFLFPPGNIQKKDYTFYESITQQPIKLHYQKEQSVNGLNTYHFQGQLSQINLGIFTLPQTNQSTRIDALIDLQLWSEKYTSTIVDLELTITIVGQDQNQIQPVLHTGISLDETYQKQLKKDLQKSILLTKIFISWLPKVLTLLSIICFASATYLKLYPKLLIWTKNSNLIKKNNR